MPWQLGRDVTRIDAAADEISSLVTSAEHSRRGPAFQHGVGADLLDLRLIERVEARLEHLT